MYLRKETGSSYPPVFQDILYEEQGGGIAATGRIPSDLRYLPEGTILAESGSTDGIFHPVKNVKAIRNFLTTATLQPYAKPTVNLFIEGEFVTKQDGNTQSTITRISNSTDTVWIATSRALGTLHSTDNLVEANAVGATTRKFYADALLKNTVKVRHKDLTTIDTADLGIVKGAIVTESSMPYPLSTQDKTQLTDRMLYV